MKQGLCFHIARPVELRHGEWGFPTLLFLPMSKLSYMGEGWGEVWGARAAGREGGRAGGWGGGWAGGREGLGERAGTGGRAGGRGREGGRKRVSHLDTLLPLVMALLFSLSLPLVLFIALAIFVSPCPCHHLPISCHRDSCHHQRYPSRCRSCRRINAAMATTFVIPSTAVLSWGESVDRGVRLGTRNLCFCFDIIPHGGSFG